MHIHAKIYKVWYLVYKNKKKITKLYDFSYFFFVKNYKYIWIEKKGQIQIRIYLVEDRKKANTNTNIFRLKKMAIMNTNTNIRTITLI